MKSIAIIAGYMSAVTLLIGLCAFHAAQAGELTSQSASNAGAQAFAIAGGGGNGMDDPQTIYRAPALSVGPSMFGGSNQNCGASEAGGISTPWGSIGGSDVQLLVGCNTRLDTKVLWQMGLRRVAKMRMLCFGTKRTREAFRASGGICPTAAPGGWDDEDLKVNVNVYGQMHR